MATPEDRRKPVDQVWVRDFVGYTPNSDPHDLRPGATLEQVNATSSTPGRLTVRRGTRVVQFGS